MNLFNTWFWNPTVETIKRDFKHAGLLDTHRFSEPTCTFLINPSVQTMILGTQGITGKALRICNQPIAVKISSIPQSVWFSEVSQDTIYNGPEEDSLTYSANYEELILRMVTRLVKDKVCGHFVCLLDSKLCSVSNMLPELRTRTNPHQKERDLTRLLRKAERDMSRRPQAKEKIHDPGVVWNLAASFLRVAGEGESAARTCLVLAMLVSNHYKHMIFPVPDVEIIAAHVYFWTTFYYSLENIRSICRRMMTRDHGQLVKVVKKIWGRHAVEFQALENAAKKITSVNFRYRHFSILSSRLWDFKTRILVSKFANGGAVEDFITNNWMVLKTVDYQVLYFQVLYALYCLAVKYPGFRHNDLHTYNVLLEISPIKVPRKNVEQLANGKYKITLPDTKRTFSQTNRPYKLKRGNYAQTTLYHLGGKKFYVPDRGFEVKIWDYDLSNMSGPNPLNRNQVVCNTKAEGLHLTAKDTYYDITFFINCMQYGLFRYKRSTYFTKTKKRLNIFPPPIRHFHTRLLREATQNKQVDPKLNRPFTYRLRSNYTKPNKIFQVMQTETTKAGLFGTFLHRPTAAKIRRVFKI